MKYALLLLASFFIHLTFSQNEPSHLTKVILTMENEMQTMNTHQTDRGQSYISDIKSEIAGSKSEDLARKRSKLKAVADRMDHINEKTEEIIDYIDALKERMINESVDNEKYLYTSILSSKGEGSYPDRLNLFALPKPLGKTIVYPRESEEMITTIENYRQAMIEAVGNYPAFYGEDLYYVNKVETVYDYSSNADYQEQVFQQMNKDGKVNYKEDKMVLLDIFTLIDNARVESQLLESGALITNLSILTTLQHKLLSARALALAQWKSKVASCSYSFNTIRPVVEGAEFIQEGEACTLVAYIAALDSYNEPTLEITSHENVKVSYEGNGTAKVDISGLEAGTHVIKGTLSIKNKSGVAKTENWEKTIEVVQK